VLAGAPGVDCGGAAESGAAYLFERGGDGSWNRIEKPIDETTSRDDFGHSVDISGLRVIAGAPKADLPGQIGEIADAGLAYIIDEQGSTPPSWPEGPSYSLEASDRSEDASFGIRVSLRGGLLLVGAEYSPGTTSTGRACLFSRNNSGAWREGFAFSATDL
jgi:hypothetical protein